MLDDHELIKRFKDGDETGFDELVRRYQQRVYALLYRLVRNPEDAYELAQDAFVRAFRALPRFQGRSSFYTWLYRIAANLAFSFIRSRRREMVHARTDEQLDEEAAMNLPSLKTPEADFRQSRLRAAIGAAVTALPERQRAIFVMRQYDGLTNNEIAQVLTCPVGTVKANYFFAMKKLQKALKAWQ
jgi:RNA polymerase sigma-70 factor (ECF subfamily)